MEREELVVTPPLDKNARVLSVRSRSRTSPHLRSTNKRSSRRTRSPTPRYYKDGYRSSRRPRSRSRSSNSYKNIRRLRSSIDSRRYRSRSNSSERSYRKRYGTSHDTSYSSGSKQSYKNCYKRRCHHNSSRKRTRRCSSNESSDSPRPSRKRRHITRHKNRQSRSNENHDQSSIHETAKSESTLLEKLVTALSDRNSTGSPGSGLPAQNVIPDFDPQAKSQTMKNWISKINESAHVYGWSDRQTIFYALPKLKGLAKRWYDGLTTVKFTWKEWQEKLLLAFPCEHNYGDLLSEMLARKTRRNETLEEYYYDKIMLINRCDLEGKHAVDCLTHGIFDTNIKMNVQGAHLETPESVLKYFRSISSKAPDNTFKKQFAGNRDNVDSTSVRKQFDTTLKRTQGTATCYNCGESGHMVTRCTKPIIKCKKCRRFGHLEKDCSNIVNTQTNSDQNKINNESSKANTSQNVRNITTEGQGNNKYFKSITVNGHSMKSFVDLGSECSLLRADFVSRLGLEVNSDSLPTLKGFGSGTVMPKGRVRILVALDGVKEEIDAYLVEPSILPADMLVGQSFTELPQVRAYKTEHELIFYKEITATKPKLEVSLVEQVTVENSEPIAVKVCTEVTGSIYVNTDICLNKGKEYMVLPGVYSIRDGVGSVIIISLCSEPFILPRNTLIARASLLSTGSLPIPSSAMTSDYYKVLSITQESQVQTISSDQLNVDKDLDPVIVERLCGLLNSYRDCFAFTLEELGETSFAEMCIQLKDDTPVTYRPYRLSLSEREKVNTIVSNMLANGIIRESKSEYASPIILVAKKNGEPRLCVDYRALNRKTVKEKFPMPIIDDQIDSLSEQVYFTSLDLTSGYHQVPISEESKHVTAFVTPDGHYEYNRMPFGLTNAPAVFQRLVLNLLKRRPISGVSAYMDDIIIATKTLDEGIEKLQGVLDILKEANLTLNLAKCNFFKRRIDYLGFEISSTGVRPGQKKVEAVAAFKTPQNVHEVRQFVGLSSFFRRFVQNYASIAKPLTSLTKNNVPWVWGEDQCTALSKLKEILTSRPVLAIYNPKYETELHTDASSIGLGGILLQRPNNETTFRAVAYFSRQTTAEEQHYHSYELETLAVVSSLKRFRVYLLGLQFKVVTDCNALRTTLTKRDLIPRIARWWLLVQEFSFSIEYRPGSQLAHADALSRNPVPFEKENLSTVMQIGEIHWLQAVQMSDPKLYHVKAVLDTKCQEAKDIRNNYELKDGKIYRRVGDELRWAVPRDARWKIMQQCHDQAGHFSYDKTLEKIRRDYWFPRMAQFARKYVRACIPCAHAKVPGGKKQGMLHPIPKINAVFHCFHIDHLGPFVKSKRGNVYILGIIDSFTKFIILRSVKNTKSKTSINVLKEVFSLFGTPKILISDRGTSFTSNEFKAYIDSVGIKHTLNAVATPRANGQIERYNRSVLASLTALCHGNDDRDWDLKLTEVQWSLNNTVNQTTGKSPAAIIFGKPTVSVSEGHLHELGDKEQVPPEAIERIREEVANNVETQQEKMKSRYDSKRCKAKVYEVGDLVMVQKNSKTPGESHKLVSPFSGPYRVTAVFAHDRYEHTAKQALVGHETAISYITLEDAVAPCACKRMPKHLVRASGPRTLIFTLEDAEAPCACKRSQNSNFHSGGCRSILCMQAVPKLVITLEDVEAPGHQILWLYRINTWSCNFDDDRWTNPRHNIVAGCGQHACATSLRYRMNEDILVRWDGRKGRN
ncbi:hypothetical protein MSG28_000554 [Choristoneura fumiferana]|uniref:Uncharacterized protein n=1 Tax=Choristoneura fumiferana TaxID=7141 RepID=A0ACC0K1D7_CHOFU|nr:hypothetical protein MSG28_000554 [Choristoneura fumiferana]